MSKTVSASVGIRGRNIAADVKTIQELLNGVAPADGGPQPILKVDGLCGPKTEKAIQEFQLRHFGWKGADGRVDPNGQTLAKLNELNAQPILTSSFSVTQCQLRGTLRRANPPDWFLLIEPIPTPFRGRFGQAGLYWFGPAGAFSPAQHPLRAEFIGRPIQSLSSYRPVTLDALAGPAQWEQLKGMTGDTFDTLKRPSLFETSMRIGMDPNEPAGPGVRVLPLPTGTVITQYPGTLHLVERFSL